MQVLGYIVTSSRLKTKYEFISVVKDISMVEEGKPYLVIGLSEAKKIASDKFSILNKSLENNGYWTFGRTERRDEYESDLNVFYNKVITDNIDKIKYIYINILYINFNLLKRLLTLCYNKDKKYIYIWNDMIYVLCSRNTVIGISLAIMKYMQYDANKIIKRIKSNPNNIICENDGCISTKIRRLIRHKQYVVPYIMFLMS